MFVSFEKTLEGAGEGVGVTHSHTQQGCISLAHKKLAHIFRVTLFLYGLPACMFACRTSKANQLFGISVLSEAEAHP